MIEIIHALLIRKKEGKFFLILLMILTALVGFNIQGQVEDRNYEIVVNESPYTLGFSTFFGGFDDENGFSIATSADGSCYVTGWTYSSNFPTLNAYNNTLNGIYDAFVAKFDENGSLLWSTYLGGSEGDEGWGITVGTDGSSYIMGRTTSNDFPVGNSSDNTYNGSGDAFVVKFSAEGSLLWSTYLGGNGDDYGSSIAIGINNSCFVTGVTYSDDYPTVNAYNSTYGGDADAFVTKFNENGSLLWSTYLGGNEYEHGFDISVGTDGSCYLTGETESNNFPTLKAYDNSYNGGPYDAFITKFSDSGALLWSTFLGGNDNDDGEGIAVNTNGDCYVTGWTSSSNFPTKNAYDSNLAMYDAFVTKLSPNGSLLWSTFLGGSSWEYGADIAVTEDGSCFAIGYTYSNDFPTLNAYNGTFGGTNDVFVTEFSVSGTLRWSTYIGGLHEDFGLGITMDVNGNCFITGHTFSSNFPTVNAYQDTYKGGFFDVFLSKFVEVEDVNGPTISAVVHSPVTPTNKDNITISCQVTDISGIKNVTLHYVISGTDCMKIVMMDGNGNIYSTKIGPFNATKVITYYIKAEDDSPNHNIAIEDNDGQMYEITIQASTKPISGYGFLTFIILMPILVSLLRKRRK